MRLFRLTLAGLLSFAVLGCSDKTQEAAKTDAAESEEASKEMPGMKGLEEGSRAWVRAKLARNNLRMIGLALANFIDTTNGYPYPGGVGFLPEELRWTAAEAGAGENNRGVRQV
jgi:hypothetical protein